MPRATNAPASRARRKRILKKAKGYRGRRSKLFRYAKDATMKAQYWAYRQRLNAAARAHGISYSRFAEGLKAAGVGLDRKILADLAVTDEATFKSIVDQAKSALEKKAKKAA